MVWLTLTLWLSNYALLTLSSLAGANPNKLELAGARALIVLFGLTLCFILHKLLSRLADRPFRTRAIMLALMALVAAELHGWANQLIPKLVLPFVASGPTDWSADIFGLAFWIWFFIAWAGLYLALEYSFDAKEEAQRSSELKTLAHHAKLSALHNQINPHFLFNSLNSISALILDQRPQDAEAMVSRLAGFLRMTLGVDPLKDIPLSQEVAMQQVYLDIERLRYPDLDIEVALPEQLRHAAVPALILQPLVENAVKHGVAASASPTKIIISAAQVGNRLIVDVVNESAASRGESRGGGPGIGLMNVRERLAQRFGDAQSFAARHAEAGRFRVTMAFPLSFHS